jgi:hypothetical protein
MAFAASLVRASKRPRLVGPVAARCATTSAIETSSPSGLVRPSASRPPVAFTSTKPYAQVSPITPPLGPRRPPVRDLQPIPPEARPHAPILPRSETDPLSNPAAALVKDGQEIHYVQYPYYVNRTAASGALPVYTDLRGSGTKQKLTIIRRIDGDVEVHPRPSPSGSAVMLICPTGATSGHPPAVPQRGLAAQPL